MEQWNGGEEEEEEAAERNSKNSQFQGRGYLVLSCIYQLMSWEI